MENGKDEAAAPVEMLTPDAGEDETPIDVLRNILRVCRSTNETVSKILQAMQPPKEGERKDRLAEFKEVMEALLREVGALPDELEGRVKNGMPGPLAIEILKRLSTPAEAAEGGGGGAAPGAAGTAG